MHDNLENKIFTTTKALNDDKVIGRNTIKSRLKTTDDKVKIRIPSTNFKQNDPQIVYQKWMFNGFIIEGPDFNLCVDPAADFLSRCSMSDIDLTLVDYVFLSHAHFDHYSSLNILSEQIELGGKMSNAEFFLPIEAIDAKVINDYHRGENRKNGPKINILDAHNSWPIGKSAKITPVPAFHSISGSFGFVLEWNNYKIGYTGDTGYATKINCNGQVMDVKEIKDPLYEIAHIEEYRESLKEAYAQCDFLIANINSFEYNKHSKTHLTVLDLVHMLKGSKMKKTMIAHLPIANAMQQELLNSITKYIEIETGVKSIPVLNHGLHEVICC